MKPRALIIEDDPEIVAALADRLDSLGHDHDCVVAQTETRERLDRCTYDYVILDLELPVRFGRPASISTGKNILVEIRTHPKHTRVPLPPPTTARFFGFFLFSVNAATMVAPELFPQKQSLKRLVSHADRTL
ncbi:MAG: response regulator [Verrucomicrobia bacterium]|nr:response regulator [Verrucomicrobiota bacterium]